MKKTAIQKPLAYVLTIALIFAAQAAFAGLAPGIGLVPGMELAYADSEYADIPDGNLKAGINAYLANRGGIPRAASAEILKTELASITDLSLDRKGIADITGLELCTNMKNLSLNENLIEDVSPLSGLSNLVHLYINNNRISDFTPLAGTVNASAILRIYAVDQKAIGERLKRTSESLTFEAQVGYRPGAVFSVWNFKPMNANGTYFPATNLISYSPIRNNDDITVSYNFSFDEKTSAGAGKEILLGGTVTHDVYVPWCTATFDAGEGAFTGDKDSVTVIEGYPLEWIPGAERTGYSLDRWEDGEELEVTESAVITTDTAVHAVWEANKYTLSYDLNGGDSVVTPGVIVTYDSAIGPLAVPQRKGYTFTGWHERPDGGLETTEGAIWKSVEDRTIYASWVANTYAVFFDVQGGSSVPSHKFVVYDDIYGELPIPAYKGKVFDGWHTEPQGGERVEPIHDVKTDSNHTLYAHYSDVDRSSIRPTGKNEWKVFEGSKYRFNKKGIMLTGLRKVGKHYYYFDSAGRLLTSGKVRLAGYALKADAKGRITNMPRPNRTTVTKAKAKGKKVNVKWKKLIGVSGYQVQYALDRDFTKEIGIRTVKGARTLKKTVGRLSASKRYYVRVRGYFIIDGLKVPGKYSKPVRSRR